MRTSKILTVIGIVAAAVAIAIFIGWFASRESKTPGTGSQANAVGGSENGTRQVGATPPTPEPIIEPISTNGPFGDAVKNRADKAAVTDWSTQFDDLFTDPNLDTDQMAAKMLEIYPHLKPEEQKDAIEHILNLVPDEGFTPVGKILLNPKTSEEISDDIMNDIGNRPGSIRMPLLLQVAKDPSHPKAAEARELLELYIEPEEELGNDWGKWEKEMKKYLEENPD